MRLFKRLDSVGEVNGVRHTDELDRVLALPRRDLDLEEVRVALTQHMRTPSGEQELWDEQALFLNDLFECRGAFAHLPVGEGKSLPSLLAGTLLELSTVLLVPSELIPKTEWEAQEYAKHWEFEMPEVIGYGMLSHKDHADDLTKAAPQMILADEVAPHLFNRGSACTRRVAEYLTANPETVFAALSGTLINPSLLKYHHLMRWSLGKERMPLPATEEVALGWAQALDPEPPMSKARLTLGALTVFGSTRAKANTALGKHMGETPGVIYTKGKSISASLQIIAWYPKRPPEVVREAIQTVMKTRKRPDGMDLDDTEVGQVVACLHLGFYLFWLEEAPRPWLKARKEWYAYCRRVLAKEYGGIDSIARIEDAIEAEEVEIRELKNWQEVRKSFKPVPTAEWLSTSVLEEAAAFAQRLPNCVVWSRYRCVGKQLEAFGLPHFGKKGLGPGGVAIEKTTAKHISASIRANSTGRNLQFQFNHSLVLTPMANEHGWEQLIGREHRKGQKADTVYTHVLASRDMKKVLTDARHLERVSRSQRKLNIADWIGFD